MSGELNLDSLLKNMDPVLSQDRLVFLTLSKKISLHEINECVLFFKESEGNTLVVKEQTAIKLGEKFDYIWALITLNVHSDLQAIGFLAAVTKRLAERESL